MSSASVKLAPLSQDPLINAIIGSYRWVSNVLSYSFPAMDAIWSQASITGYATPDLGGEPWSTAYGPILEQNQPLLPKITQTWAAVAQLQFIESVDQGNTSGIIRIAHTQLANKGTSEAWTYYPSRADKAGDIWLSGQSEAANSLWEPGSYAYFIILHELGHALGLKHPFEGQSRLPSLYDNQSLTVMSYVAATGEVGSRFSYYPTTPMLIDIAAIQTIYGANNRFNNTDTLYQFTDASTYHETLWDGGGEDTLRYMGHLPSIIDLNPLRPSTIGQPVYIEFTNGQHGPRVPNIWIAQDVFIENLQAGTADDTLIGNMSANLIDGGEGIDRLILQDSRANYAVTRLDECWLITHQINPANQDTLRNVERLQFTDTNLALDLAPTQSAGLALQILATVAYPEIDNPAVVGLVLTWTDAGMNMQAIFQQALEQGIIAEQAGDTSNQGLAKLVVKNLISETVAESTITELASLMEGDGGTLTQVDFLVAAAQHPLNQAHISLLGIETTGIYYEW